MPIFLPLLNHFGIDPIFFGILIALNLQTSFLTPPVAMSAFYLKGVAPPQVTLSQIFKGALPFLCIGVLAMVLVYMFPGIALWLPSRSMTEEAARWRDELATLSGLEARRLLREGRITALGG